MFIYNLLILFPKKLVLKSYCQVAICLALIILMPVMAEGSELQCLQAPKDASDSFGFSVAAVDHTILVGDPQANTVWVYEKDANGFREARALRPPPESEAAKYGKGFGRSVAIDESGALVIGAFFEEALGVAPRGGGAGWRRLSAVFVADNTAALVREIPGLGELRKMQGFGFSVARHGRHVAVGLRSIAGERYGMSSVLLLDIDEGSQTLIEAPTPDAAMDFGYSLSITKGVLLIGAPWLPPSGGAAVYDLGDGTQSILFAPESASRTGFSVAIDGVLAALGGEVILSAHIDNDKWTFTEVLVEGDGTVAVSGGRVGILSAASRALGGAVTDTPPLDFTVIERERVFTERLASPGGDAEGRWPHRALAMTPDFAVIARPTEADNCKVATVHFSE